MARQLSDLLGTYKSSFKVGVKTKQSSLDASALTVNRTHTLQDKAGTVALLTDVLGQSALVYSNTSIPAGNTVANTTTETAFTSTYALPANSLTAGTVLRIRLYGLYGTAIAPPNLTGKVKLGSTIVLNTGALTTIGSLSNVGWWAEAIVVVDTTGASGTVDAQGYAEFATAATTGLSVNITNTAAITLDTTAAQAITVTVQWSAASASNTITLRQMVVEVLTPSVGGTAWTSGSIPFASGTGALTQDNTKLYWDDTNYRLGIGTNSSIVVSAGQAYVTIKGSTSLGGLEFASGAADADAVNQGILQWTDPNSTAAEMRVAAILGTLQGTTATKRGGKLGIYTKADNGSALTLAVIVDNTSKVTVGSAAVAGGLFDVGKTLSGTPSASAGAYLAISANTFTDSNTAASGTAAGMVFHSIAAPALAATNATVTTTDAATFYLAGSPAASGGNQTITNTYALWIDSGNARFDGQIVSETGGGSQWYNTTDHVTNYERFAMGWGLTTANRFEMQMKKAGSGTARAFVLNYADGTGAILVPNAFTGAIQVCFGTATNAYTAGRFHVGNNSSNTATSGTSITALIDESFAPTSTSTMIARSLDINPTYNFSAGTPGAGSYETIRIRNVETALPTGTNYFMRCSGGSAGTTDYYALKNDGTVPIFGGMTTVGIGLTATLATINLTAQTAAIGSTNLLASTPAAGQYEVHYYLRTSVAGTGTGTITVTLGWTDSVNTKTKVSGTISMSSITVAAEQDGVVTIRCTNASAITYLTTLSGTIGTSKYDVDIWLKRVA